VAKSLFSEASIAAAGLQLRFSFLSLLPPDVLSAFPFQISHAGHLPETEKYAGSLSSLCFAIGAPT